MSDTDEELERLRNQLDTRRPPVDDIERDACDLSRRPEEYCRDSMPPEHHECTRLPDHDDDHVAAYGGMVRARFSEEQYNAFYWKLSKLPEKTSGIS